MIYMRPITNHCNNSLISLQAAVAIQRHVRGMVARHHMARQRRERAAVLLQAAWRGFVQRRRFLHHQALMRQVPSCFECTARLQGCAAAAKQCTTQAVMTLALGSVLGVSCALQH